MNGPICTVTVYIVVYGHLHPISGSVTFCHFSHLSYSTGIVIRERRINLSLPRSSNRMSVISCHSVIGRANDIFIGGSSLVWQWQLRRLTTTLTSKIDCRRYTRRRVTQSPRRRRLDNRFAASAALANDVHLADLFGNGERRCITRVLVAVTLSARRVCRRQLRLSLLDHQRRSGQSPALTYRR